MAAQTVAPICSIKPVSKTCPKAPVLAERLLKLSLPGKPFLVGTALFSEDRVLPAQYGGNHGSARKVGGDLVSAATGSSGDTPTLHVGRLWLKQASKAGKRTVVARM